MKLDFHINNSDPRKAVKNIGEVVHTVNDAQIYGSCSLMSPEFLVNYSIDIAGCNYVIATITSGNNSIESRYFIKDKIVMPGGKILVICAKDVLSTWWNHLKECTANVIRQERENHYGELSRYILDREMAGKVNTCVFNYPFNENPLRVPRGNDYSYVVTVVGGTDNTQSQLQREGDVND